MVKTYNKIDIWAPRWRDRTLLVAAWKVGTDNKVEITAAKKDGTRYYPEPFYLSGENKDKWDTQRHDNGSLMYIVPMSELEEWQEE